MDKERLALIINNIETNLQDADERFSKEESFTNKLLFDAGCMALFQALNRSIDLAEEVLVQKKLEVPAGYSDSFVILEKHKLIDKDTSEGMRKLVKYRNLISHEYYNITPKDVKKILGLITHADTFLDQVRKLIK
ncbi:MAG: DUF86 domain-containing protein [Candidatus Micrarchaeota archaeon]|nr:DUF86 domain-containing protein [Candidatus Micrarchaeota archaeon]